MEIKLIKASFQPRKWHLMIIMRTFIFLCCTTLLALTPSNIVSQNSKIKIEDNKVLTVDEVFDLIMEQTDYKFFYEEGIFNDYPKVNVKKGTIRTNKLLQQSLSKGNLSFQFITSNNAILIKEVLKEKPAGNLQQSTISGTITGDNGLPLVGANIIEKGTTNGTQTDFDGKYTLTLIDKNATLVISYLGFVTQEISASGKTVVNVAMEESSSILEEVVVVGYGTQKKANISGAISSVDLTNVENRPVTSLSQALAGTTSGVTVMQNSSAPGNDTATIYIRGLTTVNNTSPLIVVDGIPGSSINAVSFNDVESISVLKDAASSAIYGSRAANGVILITTKKGKPGKVSASYNYFHGISTATRLGDFVTNSADYMELRNIAFANGGDSPLYSEEIIEEFRNGTDPILHPNTDWMDYVMGGTGDIQSHNVVLQGGTDASRYRISLGYVDQTGVQPNTGTNNYTFRTNISSDISEKLKVEMNLFGRWSNIYNPGGNDVGLFAAERSTPMTLPVHPDGRYGGVGTPFDTQVRNAQQVFDTQQRDIEDQRFNGDITARYEIFKGLTLRGTASIQFQNRKNKFYNLPYELWDFRTNTVDFVGPRMSLTDRNDRDYTVTLIGTANYVTTIADNHNLSVLIGAEQTDDNKDWIQGFAAGFVTDNLFVLDAGLDETTHNASGTGWDDTLRSFFGNLNYDYKEKYLLTANLRYDASSRFNPDFRWNLFPAFSGAWKISKESFMDNVDFISNLQLRAGWGQVGNNTLGRYKYFQSYDFGSNSYFLGGAVQPGVGISELANPNVTWETTEETDLGIDIGLLNNALTISAGVFDQRTKDVLLQVEIPSIVGVSTPPTRNLGEVSNKGWELDVGYRKKINEFSFSVNLNVSHVKNKVVKYNDVPFLNRFMLKEGLPMWSLFGYETDGLFQSDQEVADAPFQNSLTGPGDLKFVDQLTVDTDGDGIPDEADGEITPDDRVVLGNPFPKYTYGINLAMNWKDFDFSAILQGREGSKGFLLGTVAFGHTNGGLRGHIPAKYQNAWSPENPNSTVPRLNSNQLSQSDNDYFIQNTSYLKVRNVQLGYSLPASVLDRIGISRLRVYGSAENLFTFTKFEGWDPERSLFQAGVTYPIHKTFTFGINLTF